MLKKYSKTFVKNACALEEKLHGLNVPAAFDTIHTQKKVDAGSFYAWLFTKYSDYPVDAARPTYLHDRVVSLGGTLYIMLSARYYQFDDSYIRVEQSLGVLHLVLSDNYVEISSHMFLDVFSDMCNKFKKHVEQQLVKDAQELLNKAKTLQLKSPFVQVFLEEPNYEALPKAKPVLMLERKQFDTESGYVHIQITKAQAEAFKKMQSA